jgi:hypothetical protein
MIAIRGTNECRDSTPGPQLRAIRFFPRSAFFTVLAVAEVSRVSVSFCLETDLAPQVAILSYRQLVIESRHF